MCGGLGSRMLPLSEKTPKPMLRVLNRPVLDLIVQKLIRDGFREIVLTLGYRAEEIVAYMETRRYDAEIAFCTEEKPLGTAGGVKNALKDAPDDFLVLSGDNLFDFDLDRLREQHYLSGKNVTIVGTEAEDPRDYGVIVSDAAGNVAGFSEKPDWEDVRSTFVNTGIYFCAAEVLTLIPEGEFFDFAKDLFPKMLKEGKRISCVKAEGSWFDIGGIAEYRATNAALLKDPDNLGEDGGLYFGYDRTDEDGNRFIAPCLLGPGVKLGGGVTVGPFTTLGGNTAVGRDCVITDSIVGEGCAVGSGTDIHASVIADGARIRENVLLDEGAAVGYGAEIGRFSRVFPGVRISAGVRIPPESLVSSDVREQSCVSAEFDAYGMSGAAYSGVTLADALKIGQAIASAAPGKTGFACDGSPAAEVYKNVCQYGAVACGAQAYDFGTIFRNQVCFYSQHCSLGAFVFVACREGEISFFFAGENGFPLEKGLRRKIADCFRYGSFRYAEDGGAGRLFRMELYSSVYKSKLKKMLAVFRGAVELTVESSDRCLTETVGDVLSGQSPAAGAARVMLIADGGGEAYFAEDDKVFYVSAVQLFVCEYEFARGNDVAVPEDAPEAVEERAAAYGKKAYRVGAEGEQPDRSLLFNCLWAFDSVFLAFRVCGMMAQTKMRLADLLEGIEAVSVRKSISVFDCSPGQLRRGMEQALGERAAGSAWFRVEEKGRAARIRQLGNSNRVRILSEASEMEAAKELSAEIIEKIHHAVIDISDKKE